MELDLNECKWWHVETCSNHCCSLDSQQFTLHTLSIESIERAYLKAKIAAKVSGVGKPLLHQGTLRHFPRCINNLFRWLASKPLLMTPNAINVASPVNQSPAIARRIDDFPIPALVHSFRLVRQWLLQQWFKKLKLDEAASSLSCRWSIDLTGQCKLMRCTTSASGTIESRLVRFHMTKWPWIWSSNVLTSISRSADLSLLCQEAPATGVFPPGA